MNRQHDGAATTNALGMQYSMGCCKSAATVACIATAGFLCCTVVVMYLPPASKASPQLGQQAPEVDANIDIVAFIKLIAFWCNLVLTSNVDAEVEPVEKAGAPAPAKTAQRSQTQQQVNIRSSCWLQMLDICAAQHSRRSVLAEAS
jgi:hypothetical protein